MSAFSGAGDQNQRIGKAKIEFSGLFWPLLALSVGAGFGCWGVAGFWSRLSHHFSIFLLRVPSSIESLHSENLPSSCLRSGRNFVRSSV